MRGKDYTVLDRPEVQSRLHLPADQQFSRAESGLVRQLYDCPDVAVGPEGVRCRVVVATHPAAQKKSRIGHTRNGVVYELFFTHLPQDAFTASDVVALYLHRGAFEPVLADEDQEQDPDRWCSHAPAGQEAWQIISQWVWNLRLELGHVLEPTPMRTTEFAPPIKEATAEQAPVQGYEKQIARLALESRSVLGAGLRSPTRRGAVLSGGQDVAPNRATPRSRWQPTRALQRQDPRLSRLPFAQAVSVERGSNYEAASHQFTAASAPGWPCTFAATRDWSRREHRRACMQLLRHQRIEVSLPPPPTASPRKAEVILSRAQRAHARLSWAERLARNARVPTASRVTIRLFGVPEDFATSLGLATA